MSDPVGGDLSIEIAPDDAVVAWPTRSVQSPVRSWPAPSLATTTAGGGAAARPAPSSEHANATRTSDAVQDPAV